MIPPGQNSSVLYCCENQLNTSHTNNMYTALCHIIDYDATRILEACVHCTKSTSECSLTPNVWIAGVTLQSPWWIEK